MKETQWEKDKSCSGDLGLIRQHVLLSFRGGGTLWVLGICVAVIGSFAVALVTGVLLHGRSTSGGSVLQNDSTRLTPTRSCVSERIVGEAAQPPVWLAEILEESREDSAYLDRAWSMSSVGGPVEADYWFLPCSCCSAMPGSTIVCCYRGQLTQSDTGASMYTHVGKCEECGEIWWTGLREA